MTAGSLWISAGRPSAIFCAEVEHRDAVADVHHQAHVVLDEHHREAAVADLADEADERLLLGGVEPGGRLVEEEHLRLGGQGPGDLEAPLVAVGQVPGRLAGAVGDADELEQARGLALARVAPRGSSAGPLSERAAARSWRGGRRRPTMMFSTDVMFGNSRMFWKVRATPASVMSCGLPADDAGAVEHDLARRSAVDAGDAVEQRRLAGTVRADDARRSRPCGPRSRRSLMRHDAAELHRASRRLSTSSLTSVARATTSSGRSTSPVTSRVARAWCMSSSSSSSARLLLERWWRRARWRRWWTRRARRALPARQEALRPEQHHQHEREAEEEDAVLGDVAGVPPVTLLRKSSVSRRRHLGGTRAGSRLRTRRR